MTQTRPIPAGPKPIPLIRGDRLPLMTRAAPAQPPTASWRGRNLLALRDLTRDEIIAILSHARAMIPVADGARKGGLSRPAEPTGRVIASLFFEDSTRTRLSFAIAAHRLGIASVDLAGSGSSLSKGESLTDTARTVEAMGVDALVVRTRASGGAALIAKVKGEFGEQYWGFWMLGGMSGGGMGLLFDPTVREHAANRHTVDLDRFGQTALIDPFTAGQINQYPPLRPI